MADLGKLEAIKCEYPFLPGSPGHETLKHCTQIMRKAAEDVLTEDADVEDLFMYGETGGDSAFLKELAKFLSKEYSDEVNPSSLLLTSAATHGLHLILTTLFNQDQPIFVEDPSYFFGHRMISQDLHRNTIAVPIDEKGIVPEKLDALLTLHRSQNQAGVGIKDERSYWAALYLIPVFHNPSGITYTSDRCTALVSLARKHNILLICEDIYNLIFFTESIPRRMFAYDREMRADQVHAKGHVVSVSTFSKILAPSLRCGWIEGPDNVLSILNESNYGNSGGSFNHFMSKLMTSVLKSDVLHNHINWLRQIYKSKMDILTEVLTSHLPDGCRFVIPKGGFFLWLQLRKETDATKFLEFALDKGSVNFMPGVHCSPSESCGNCARLSVSVIPESTIKTGALRLVSFMQTF